MKQRSAHCLTVLPVLYFFWSLSVLCCAGCTLRCVYAGRHQTQGGQAALALPGATPRQASKGSDDLQCPRDEGGLSYQKPWDRITPVAETLYNLGPGLVFGTGARDGGARPGAADGAPLGKSSCEPHPDRSLTAQLEAYMYQALVFDCFFKCILGHNDG